MEQMSLFDDREVYNPLASRLRPDDLDGFVGQEHLLGRGKLLRQLIEQDKIPSMRLPGTGMRRWTMCCSTALRGWARPPWPES